MSQSLAPNESEELLQGLAAPEAKRREAAANQIAQKKLTDPRIVARLQDLAASDPYAYVREAASAALVALGQSVPATVAPAQVGRQSNTPIVLVAIIPVLVILFVACIVIAILVILGPQIGNVFSRITSGLETP